DFRSSFREVGRRIVRGVKFSIGAIQGAWTVQLRSIDKRTVQRDVAGGTRPAATILMVRSNVALELHRFLEYVRQTGRLCVHNRVRQAIQSVFELAGGILTQQAAVGTFVGGVPTDGLLINEIFGWAA